MGLLLSCFFSLESSWAYSYERYNSSCCGLYPLSDRRRHNTTATCCKRDSLQTQSANGTVFANVCTRYIIPLEEGVFSVPFPNDHAPSPAPLTHPWAYNLIRTYIRTHPCFPFGLASKSFCVKVLFPYLFTRSPPGSRIT